MKLLLTVFCSILRM